MGVSPTISGSLRQLEELRAQIDRLSKQETRPWKVCMYTIPISMYLYIYTYTHTYIHAYIHTYTSTYIYLQVFIAFNYEAGQRKCLREMNVGKWAVIANATSANQASVFKYKVSMYVYVRICVCTYMCMYVYIHLCILSNYHLPTHTSTRLSMLSRLRNPLK